MEEVKISKKSKVGILSFVTGFEEFAELAETIFRNAERRGDLDKAYVKLIKAVFMNGETSGRSKVLEHRQATSCWLINPDYHFLFSVEKVASESQKTPRDVVMMENFHHIFSTLSRLKISCLDAERREAKQKYTDHLQSYVINSLGQPLEKLNVGGKIATTCGFCSCLSVELCCLLCSISLRELRPVWPRVSVRRR